MNGAKQHIFLVEKREQRYNNHKLRNSNSGKNIATSFIPTVPLARVYEALIATYGTPENEPDYDPLGGLIGTIFFQHTSDINSERAYQQLITTFPTWEEVRDAPTYMVAEAIRSGGLANIKAPRIQDVLRC